MGASLVDEPAFTAWSRIVLTGGDGEGGFSIGDDRKLKGTKWDFLGWYGKSIMLSS